MDGKISLDLKEPITDSINGFDAEVNNTDSIKKELQRVFKGQENILKVHKSGSRGCLAPSSHTTGHAGPHPAVRKAPPD